MVGIRLTHGLIDVAFQCRVLGIGSTKLLHDIGLIDVIIHDINDGYNVAAILAYLFN